jgi:beta-lactamase regulating signal transducer with metallopeptidase domain
MEWLLNWVVQGTALTVLAATGTATCRRSSAATRERIWWVTLAAVLVLPLAALLPETMRAFSTWTPSSGASPLIAVPPSWSMWLLMATAAWFAWTCLRFARLALVVVRVVFAKQRAVPIAPAREARLTRWMQARTRGRFARLVLSDRIHHAAVLGFGHPVIALAPGTIGRLSDEELDQVVMHEYAHVQRRDDIWAVVQHAISAALGFHPAVWWLDRALTIEREVACDDWVLSAGSTPKSYGTCLVSLAEFAEGRRMKAVPGFTWSRSELEIRIRRLVDRQRSISVRPSRTAVLAVSPLLVCLALAVAALEIFGPTAIDMPFFPGGREALAILRPIPFDGVGLAREEPSSTRRQRAPTEKQASRSDEGAELETIGPGSEHAQPGPGTNELAIVDSDSARGHSTVEAQSDLELMPAEPAPTSNVLAPELLGIPPTFVSEPEPPSPWSSMAASSVIASRRTQAAAVGTARLFSRFGKSVGAAFRSAVVEPVER